MKNIATVVKKLNLFSSHYSHFRPALEEAKNVARIFSPNFKNDKLKNEARELTANMNTAYNLF